MPTHQYKVWEKMVSNAMYANLFGPTETVDICAYYKLTGSIKCDQQIPVGCSCDNIDSFILDENKTIVDPSEGETRTGELYVRGSTLAYGYWKNKNKTDDVFVQNPLHNDYPEIVYRTGDMMHYNEEGYLIYDGRRDYQIKHMGHRIEVGEIETVAGSLDDVSRCVVMYNENNKKIYLFFVGKALKNNIVKELKRKLPLYMIPSEIINLKVFPINTNGKIDRLKLKEKWMI